MKIDLNAPAFGEGAQKPEAAVVEPEVKVEAPQVVPEPKVEEPKVEPEGETQVPYSRFKKFHDAAREAQEAADYWKAKAEERLEAPAAPAPVADDMPPQWVKLYGDSDDSKAAWEIQKNLLAEMREQTRTEALEAVRNQQHEEKERTEQNVERLDDGFEDLAAKVGRDLTEIEQSAILDIVDDYTPKDEDGNYAGDILSFDKAWEIYELKNAATKAPKIQQRNNVAGILGNQSQGEPNNNAEQNKNWNPLDWDAWKRRI